MVTAVDAGKHVCLEVARFRDLVASGVFKRMPTGRYNLDTVRESYCRHMQKVAAGRSADGGAALSTQRAKLAEAQTRSALLKNAKEEGKVVDLDLMLETLGVVFATMREIALSVPGKCSDALTPYTPNDRAAIYEILRAEIYEMLTNLATVDNYPMNLTQTDDAPSISKKAKR
jgi:phage terminase Nu1 subunit (DNA packaging protein)